MLRYRACVDRAQGTAQTPDSSTQVSQNLGELPLVPRQPCRQAPPPRSWLCEASRWHHGVRVLSLPGLWKLASGHLVLLPLEMQLLLLVSS